MNALEQVKSLARRGLRAYTLHSPIRPGKERLRGLLGPYLMPSSSTVETSIPFGLRLKVIPGEYVSDQIFFYGCFERPYVDLVAEALAPGMTFVDVGGHVGLYTVIGAARVGTSGRVITFEPSQRMFDILSSNVRLNRVSQQTKVFKAALSDRAGTAQLHVPTVNAAASLAVPLGPSVSEPVQTVVLDEVLASLSLTSVDVMKLDIEGAELSALNGAKELLGGACAPGVIQIELDERHTRRFGHSTVDVMAFLRSFGYDLFRLENARLQPLPDTAAYAVDAIAVRRDRPAGQRLTDRFR